MAGERPGRRPPRIARTKPPGPSVDDYLASQPPASRPALIRVRRAIRRAIPSAEETISYRIPAYKQHGRPIVYFAGWARHYSLYPCTDRVLLAFGHKLARYDVSKGTIRFPLAVPVPVKLIQDIAKLRAKEEVERAKARTTAASRRT